MKKQDESPAAAGMPSTKSVSAVPNIKLLQSLGHLGYNVPFAIAEFIDNSLDANSTLIQIVLHSDRQSISIADNGEGMTEDQLIQALTLASESKKSRSVSLGVFGMGLKSAMLSLGTGLRIITKKKGGELLVGEMDIEKMISKNSWEIEIRKGGFNELNDFKFEHNLSHGTIVEILNVKKHESFVNLFNGLKKPLGQIFRKFIDESCKIKLKLVKGKDVLTETDIAPVDPLQLPPEVSVETSKIFKDELIEVKYKSGNKELTENVRIRIAFLPNIDYMSNPDKRKIGYNIPNQGFYILRNNRELFPATSMGMFSKHNDFNRFRGEIFFSANLDDVLALTFNKRSAANINNSDESVEVVSAVQQSFMDSLGKVLKSYVTASREILKAESALSEEKPDEKVTQEDQTIVDDINKNSNRFSNITPEATDEEDDNDIIDNDDDTAVLTKPKKKRINEVENDVTTEDLYKLISFKYQSYGVNGPVYRPTFDGGKKITIIWNTSHPFYEKYKNQPVEFKKLIVAFIYGYVRAEYTHSTTNKHQILFDDVHNDAGSHIRKLLS